MSTKPQTQPVHEPPSGRKYFTLDEANRALPYVSRIMQDVREAYQQAVELQERIDRPMPGDDAVGVGGEYERTVERLNRYVEELHDMGVELKDYELGLVDFPAIHDGREVYLCWRCGEKSIIAWHELDAGFSGRQDVALLDPPDETD